MRDVVEFFGGALEFLQLCLMARIDCDDGAVLLLRDSSSSSDGCLVLLLLGVQSLDVNEQQ